MLVSHRQGTLNPPRPTESAVKKSRPFDDTTNLGRRFIQSRHLPPGPRADAGRKTEETSDKAEETSGYFRYRLPNSSDIASARDRASLRKLPRTAEVTVVAPGLRTPRMDMHRCSHSSTTITPRGSRIRIRASAIWQVIRSCTCGRLAYTSASLASLDRPVISPLPFGM